MGGDTSVPINWMAKDITKTVKEEITDASNPVSAANSVSSDAGRTVPAIS